LLYLERPALRWLLLLLWVAAALPLAALCWFFGLFVHESLLKKQPLALLALVPSVVRFFVLQGTAQGLVLLASLAVATVLARRAVAWRDLSRRFYTLADESKTLHARLELRQQQLLESQDAGIQLATLDERNRIARDIHDNVGHLLSSALLQIAALQASLRAEQPDSAEAASLNNVHDTLHQGMDAIRSSVHQLHAESLDLEQQLRHLLKNFSFCRTQARIDLYRTPPRVFYYAILAIVKEALSNVARHSDASLVELRLREHPAFYQLVLSDNGRLSPEPAGRPLEPEGIGLRNIRDRVEALGGRLQIDRQAGFSLFISLPKEAADDSGADNR